MPSRDPWWGSMRSIMEWARSITVPLFGSTQSGLAPASDGSSTKFLRADGQWSVVGGTIDEAESAKTGIVTSTGTDFIVRNLEQNDVSGLTTADIPTFKGLLLDSGYISVAGDATNKTIVLRGETVSADPVELFLDGSTIRAQVPENAAWLADIRVIGREEAGGNHAIYHRRACIENTAGTTALVSTVQSIGPSDIETDGSWDVSITADDTADALTVEVTGSSTQKVRWVAVINYIQVIVA